MTDFEVYNSVLKGTLSFRDFSEWVINETHKAYDGGYDEGYSDGYNQGYDEALSSEEAEADEFAYNEGFNDGRVDAIRQLKEKQ